MASADQGSVVSPRDAASGLPTGKRQHKPITITKELDRTSPTFVTIADLNGDGDLDLSLSLKNNSKDITCKGGEGQLEVMWDFDTD